MIRKAGASSPGRVKCTECELELEPREVAGHVGLDKRPFCRVCWRLKPVPYGVPEGARWRQRHYSDYEDRYSVELVNQERKALNDPYLPYVRE